MRGAQIVVALALSGCGGEVLAIELSLTDGGCEPAVVESLAVLAVQINGLQGGAACTFNKKCYGVPAMPPPSTVDDLAEILRGQDQPILDADFDGAEEVWLFGLDTCFFQSDPAALCGFADLDAEQSGDLELRVKCDACPPPIELACQ